jgi:hypothetical protein
MARDAETVGSPVPERIEHSVDDAVILHLADHAYYAAHIIFLPDQQARLVEFPTG